MVLPPVKVIVRAVPARGRVADLVGLGEKHRVIKVYEGSADGFAVDGDADPKSLVIRRIVVQINLGLFLAPRFLLLPKDVRLVTLNRLLKPCLLLLRIAANEEKARLV